MSWECKRDEENEMNTMMRRRSKSRGRIRGIRQREERPRSGGQLIEEEQNKNILVGSDM
jgi:hypothetical protein